MTELRLITDHPRLMERIADALDCLRYGVDAVLDIRADLDELTTKQMRELRDIIDENSGDPEPEPPAPPAPRIEPGWFSLIEAGRYLGFTAGTVRIWVHDGRLPAKRFGRAIRIRIEDLDAFGSEIGVP